MIREDFGRFYNNLPKPFLIIGVQTVEFHARLYIYKLRAKGIHHG